MSREEQKFNPIFSCSSRCWKWLRKRLESAAKENFPPHTQQGQEFQWYPHREFVLCLNNSLLTSDTGSACFCSLKSKYFLGAGVTGTVNKPWCQGTSHPPWTGTVPCRPVLQWDPPQSHPHICGAPLSENVIFPRRKFCPCGSLFTKSRLLEKTPPCVQKSPFYSCSQPDLNCWNTSF